MRFAQNRGTFADDEGFMEAIYEAGLQVEELKALEKVREEARGSTRPSRNNRPDDKKRDERRNEERKPAVEAKRSPTNKTGDRQQEPTKKRERWETVDAALKGVPQGEIDNPKENRDNCWRCR